MFNGEKFDRDRFDRVEPTLNNKETVDWDKFDRGKCDRSRWWQDDGWCLIVREEEEALDRLGGERRGDAALKRKHTHTPTYTQYAGNGFQLCSPLGFAPIKQTSSTEKYVHTRESEGDSSEELQCNSPELITTAHCLVREGSHSVHSRFLFCKTVRLGFGRCATDVARHIYKVQRQWGLGSRQWLAGICFGRTYIAFDYWRSLPSARFFIAFTSPISADSCLQSYLL